MRRLSLLAASLRSAVPFGVALGLALVVGGCDSEGDTSFRTQVAVEAYQIVDAPLAPVYLTRTAAADQPYRPSSAAITDAVVSVSLLDASGSVERRVAYRLANASQGRYEAVGTAPAVQPLRTYRLDAVVPGQAAPVTAQTLTPGRFRILASSPLNVAYTPLLTNNVATFTVSRPTFPGKSASFVFTSESLLPAPGLDDVVPFLRSILDRNGDGTPDFREPQNAGDNKATFEDFRTGSSPVLNEANYTTNGDGSLTIDLPWITVLFFGDLRVSTSALDDNLYDYLRSQAVQQGGTGLSPGEVPNLLARVQNGTGIFGSLSRISATLTVRKP